MPLRPDDTGTDLHGLVGGRAVLTLAAGHGFPAATPEAAVASAIGAGATPFVSALAERIALAVATVAAVLDPPLVVLGGDVAQAGGAVLRDAVAHAFAAATPFDTPIAVTALTDDAVLLGALDAGLRAVRETLIDSLRHTPVAPLPTPL
jgi:predicted NBD/HSP70 family sugar kinase